MDNLIADQTRRNLSRPAHDKWYSQRSFKPCEVAPAPWTTPTIVARKHFWPIIRSEDKDGVVCNAESIEGIEQFACVGVDLHQYVTPVAIATFSSEFLARNNWHVCLCVG